MPVEELLFSGDTTEEGRVKINNTYTQDCIWTGSTGDFTGITKNIITNNDANNIISGNSLTNSSFVEYSAILAGVNNSIYGQAPFNTSIKNSAIVAGNTNLISHNNGFVDIENCVIVGGANNAITGTSDISNTVIIGGQDLTGNTSNRVYTKNFRSFGGRIRNNRSVTLNTASYVNSGTAPFEIQDEDEHFLVINATNSFSYVPPAGYWNIDIKNLVFNNAKIGRVVDIVAYNSSLFPTEIRLGADVTAGVDYYINDVINDIFVVAYNWDSVRIVVSDIVGSTTYLQVYGTGA